MPTAELPAGGTLNGAVGELLGLGDCFSQGISCARKAQIAAERVSPEPWVLLVSICGWRKSVNWLAVKKYIDQVGTVAEAFDEHIFGTDFVQAYMAARQRSA
jgi:hypothetical protein